MESWTFSYDAPPVGRIGGRQCDAGYALKGLERSNTATATGVNQQLPTME